jgi:hypothetical protein
MRVHRDQTSADQRVLTPHNITGSITLIAYTTLSSPSPIVAATLHSLGDRALVPRKRQCQCYGHHRIRTEKVPTPIVSQQLSTFCYLYPCSQTQKRIKAYHLAKFNALVAERRTRQPRLRIQKRWVRKNRTWNRSTSLLADHDDEREQP